MKVQLQKYPIWLWRLHFQHWRWATLNGALVRLRTASLCTAPAYWYCCALERFSLPCLCLRSLFHKKMKNRGRPEKTLIPSNFRFVLENHRISGKQERCGFIILTFSCLLFRLKAAAISPVLWTMWNASRFQCDAAVDWLPEESRMTPAVNSHLNYSCIYCEITCCLGTAMIGWIGSCLAKVSLLFFVQRNLGLA